MTAPTTHPASVPCTGAKSELLAAVARYRTADAAHRDYDENVHKTALNAYEAAVAKVPHHQTTASFINMNGDRHSLSTNGAATVDTARRVLQDVKDGHIFTRPIAEADAEYPATVREVVIAADKRAIEIGRLRAKHRIDEIVAQLDAIGRQTSEVLYSALAVPACDLGELLVKADLIAETELWDLAGDDLIADIRRLVGETQS